MTERKRNKFTSSLSMVEQLDRELTCQFCLGTLDDPRMLPCLHVYCKQCILGLEMKHNPSLYKCPECQETFVIPDVNKLPVHKIANSKKRDLLLLRRISGNTIKCELCPVPHKHAAQAIYICLDCREGQQFLCHGCSEGHYNRPELKDHQLELLNSVNQSSSSDTAGKRRTVWVRRSSVFSDVCSDHGLQLRYFCESCKSSICSDCKSGAHAGHSIGTTASMLEDVQQIIPTELLYVVGIRDGLQQAISPIEEVKTRIASQRDYLSEEIRSRVQRIYKDLEHEESILQKQLKSTAEAKLDILSRQIREINKLVVKADQIATMLTDVDTLSYQSDILSVTHILLDKVDTLKGEYNAAVAMSSSSSSPKASKVATLKHQVSLKPSDEANIGVMLNADTIKRELREGSRIFIATAYPVLCSASGPALNNPEALKLTYFTIQLKDRDGVPCTSLQKMVVTVEKDGRMITDNVRVSHRSCGMYTVSFCPRESGECSVSVEVNDNHIKHSPFKVFISPANPVSDKTRLFQAVHSIVVPVGITQDLYGKILVTSKTQKSRIVVVDEDGKEIMKIEDEENMLRDPCGIATDIDGNIYVTSSFYHCVLKYSSTGEFLKRSGRIGRGKGNFQNPAGIRLTLDNEVFVCDASNCRVAVFDNTLQHKRDITTDLTRTHHLLSHPSNPYDVAFSNKGQMFVSDTVNDCILVFQDEQFSSAFRYVGNEKDELQNPKGIAIDNDGYLFVCDSGNQRIAVFQCDSGIPISTIELPEQYGSSSKFSPSGITVDNQGLLYVCDENGKRVIVFSDITAKMELL